MDTEVIKPTDLTGQVIGNYHIISRLGRGGMADVYKALHIELKVHRAIKFIRPEFVTSEDFRARFQKEAQAVAKLEHPNIVRIHDFGSANDQFYMVMQFVEGSDLKTRLAERGIIDASAAIDLVVAIASALAYAHERDLIHRDIKPDNIMLGADGEPILMDFGIAKLLTENTALTQTGVGIGTPAYMAPEQAQGQTITPATDIYALTVVLYELVTGRQPYSADTPIAVMLKAISDPLPLPREINPAISEELQAVILKGTAKNPLQRYQSANEFANDLRAVREGSQPSIARTAPVSATAGATTVAQTAPLHGPTPTHEPAGSVTTVVAKKVARGLTWLGGLTIAAALAGLGWWWTTADNTETVTAPATDLSSSVPEPASPDTTETTAPAVPATRAVAGAQNTQAPKSVPLKVATSTTSDSGEIFNFRNTLAKGQTLETDIDLRADDRVYLQVHKATSLTDFKLIPPDGGEPLIKTYVDKGPVAIKQTGTYRLSAVVRNGEESTVDAQLFRINPETLDGGAISFGDYHSATTQWPGQRLNYQAELTAGDVVYLEVLRSEGLTDFSLRSVDDRTDLLNSYVSKGPVEIPKSGTHQFWADPRNSNLADYEFVLHKLNPAVIPGGSYQPNSYAEGSTSQPGQIIRYEVNFEAGDIVYLEVSKSENIADYVLTEPGGRNTVFSSYTDKGPVELTRSGTYTLTVDPRGSKTTNYEFRVHKLEPGIISGGAVQANEVVSGATTQPGQIAHYSLELTQAARVGLEVIKATSITDFILRTADDRSNLFSSYKNVTAMPLQPGTYKFIVDPRGKGLSDYQFLLRVQAAD